MVSTDIGIDLGTASILVYIIIYKLDLSILFIYRNAYDTHFSIFILIIYNDVMFLKVFFCFFSDLRLF